MITGLATKLERLGQYCFTDGDHRGFTYHRSRTRLISNISGESPTLCREDSAMSIELVGVEVESIMAELAIRTVYE
jgi:hypothetical protein